MNERETSNTELAALREQQLENARQARIVRILQRVRFNGKVLRDCAANEGLILELPPQLTPDEISQAFAANPKLAEGFLWIDPPGSKTDPKVLERDQRTLEAAAREYRTFGASQANLSLVRSVLGPGFSESDLIQAFRTRRVVLSAPSDEERQHWQELDADAEKLRLMNTPAHLLKQEVRDGYADRRAEAVQAEADRAFAAKQESETGISYPALPEYLPEFLAKRFGNQRLDRSFLVRKADRETFRYLHQKFGVVAVENRLRGN